MDTPDEAIDKFGLPAMEAAVERRKRTQARVLKYGTAAWTRILDRALDLKLDGGLHLDPALGRALEEAADAPTFHSHPAVMKGLRRRFLLEEDALMERALKRKAARERATEFVNIPSLTELSDAGCELTRSVRTIVQHFEVIGRRWGEIERSLEWRTPVGG